jgi:cell division protein FtsB
MSSHRKNKRKSSDRLNNRIAVITVSVVVFSMALVVNLKVSSLKKKAALYAEQEKTLIEQVANEKERSKLLEQNRIYVQTKQYIEKIAKEKLGLVNPDEILLKPEQ